MKTYFADTNFYLRFILQDDPVRADSAEVYLQKAKRRELKIVFLSAVILEMGFVLQSLKRFERSVIADRLLSLVKTTYVEIEDRQVWLNVLPIYGAKNVDLLDVYLWGKSQAEEGEVLSFDKDLQKLSRG